ncbi:MAG TPA: ABC transporter permease [Rugosimonospora sp.]
MPAAAAPTGSVDLPRRGRVTWRRLFADRWALGGAAVVVLLVLVAVLAPVLTAAEGQDAYTYHLGALTDSGAPVGFGGGISGRHWFGVEPTTGRDLFAVVAYGARTSLLIGIGATVVAVVLGVTVGVTAGYFGGWYDRIVSRGIDVLFGFPSLIFMIAVGAIVPTHFPKSLLILAVIGFFGWPPMARVVRGQTLVLRRRTFVVASEAMGAGSPHVLLRQLLPNLGATIIVYATMLVPGMIGAEAALSFLGVGIPPPTPSWGRTIGSAIGWVQTDVMFLLFPGLALFAATLSFNLLGDGLRDALDPRLRGLR